MLGLLQCSVPPVLKAEVLHCLAAFGKSPEIAASLWQSLEYTQVSRYKETEQFYLIILEEGESAFCHLWYENARHLIPYTVWSSGLSPSSILSLSVISD